MTQTVIGFFDNPDKAYAAEETLLHQGIDESSFHLTAKEEEEEESGGQGRSMEEIRSYLKNLFGPENSMEAENYAEEIERGGALLSVELPDDAEIEPIQEAMLDAGAINMDERAEQWRAQEAAGEEGMEEESQSIPVIEEEMEVGKAQFGKGKVRVVSRVEETPVEEEVRLKEEHASIKRRPVDRPATSKDIENQGETSIEVEETAEKPVISKSARVVEEVEVGKETSEKSETVQDTVRRTDVEVEREPAKSSKRKGGNK